MNFSEAFKALLFALFLFAISFLGAEAATSIPIAVTSSPINVSMMASRTSGVAPLGVVFSAVGTTSPSVTTLPYHEIQYTWTFGDANVVAAGTCGTAPAAGEGYWRCGSNPGVNSKNAAIGPVAAHVFETAGTYTVTMTAYDGTNTATQSQTITVTSADTVFATTATVCFYNSTLGTGCPTGATQTASSDFDAAIASCVGTTKRCLFKRGDTFPASTTSSISAAGAIIIGAYGSLASAGPVVTGTNIGGYLIIANAAVNDLRVMDITFAGSGVGDTGTCVSGQAIASGVTFLRFTCYDTRGGIVLGTGASLANSVVADSWIYNMRLAGGVGIYGWWIQSGFIGNAVGPFAGTSEHNIRLQPGQRVAITNNTLSTPGEDGDHGKQVLTIRALEHTPDAIDSASYTAPDTQYVYIGDNKLIAGATSGAMFQVAPAGPTQNNWIYDVIAERNWMVFGANTQIGYYSEGVRLTVRNNICDASGGATYRTCFYTNPYDTTGNVPNPSYNWYYNNTCYASDTSSQMDCISLDGSVKSISNTTAKNNLGYAQVPTTPHLLVTAGTVTSTTAAGNSTNAQMKSTDPLFTSVSPFTPANAKITSTSYAIGTNNGCTGAPCSTSTGVPVWSDFFQVVEPATRDIGAVVH